MRVAFLIEPIGCMFELDRSNSFPVSLVKDTLTDEQSDNKTTFQQKMDIC